jgi:hypothetical protein
MNKRTWVWLFTTVLAVVAAAGIVWGATSSFDKVLTQNQLQQKIDAKLPFTAKTVTVENVQLSLADDKINLTFDASTVKFASQYAVSAATVGKLRYDSGRGAFFFSPEKVVLSNFSINDKVIGSKVGRFVDRMLGDSALAERKDALKETAHKVAENTIQEGSQMVLARIPLYTLKDDIKGTIIKMSLTGVEVRDNTLIAHISLWQLTMSVWIFGLMFVVSLVIAIALASSPAWGFTPLLFF